MDATKLYDIVTRMRAIADGSPTETDPTLRFVSPTLRAFADEIETAISDPSGSGSMQSSHVQSIIKRELCANCGQNPPHYCHACWEAILE